MKFRLDGLRLQLLGLFIIPVTLVVLAVSILATGIHRRAMRGLVAQRDERTAASAAAALDEALTTRLLLLELTVAQLPGPKPDRNLREWDQELRRAFPLGVGSFDINGTPLGHTVLGDEEIEAATTLVQDNSTQAAIAEREDEPVLLLAARNESIVLVGAIALRDVLHSAVPSVANAGSDTSMHLVGPGKSLLISVGNPPPDDIARHAGVEAALRGALGSFFLPMADGEHVVAFAPIPSAGWALILEEPWQTVTSSVLDLSLLAPLSLAPILLLMLLGLWFGARRVVEPLRRLEKATSELPSGGIEEIEKPTGGIAEIEELRSTLVDMTRRVSEAQAALRGYIGVITDAQEEERRRIAREIHDESIQHWIAIDHRLQMAVKRLRRQGNPEAELLSELHQETQTGIQDLRRLSRGLRPIFLEDLGLVPAIEMLAQETEARLGIPVACEVQGDELRLAPEVELAVYRMVQEGLSNVQRHAEASSATIVLKFRPEQLHVLVQDDGRGFAPTDQVEQLAAAGHYGLMGMKERADAVGGQLDINSAPGSGTSIHLSIPILNAPDNG